ncbi:MAG: thiaminase II [Eubacterium sp.]|nr:thiaminase II [Eubacterium sp.]
MKTTERLLQAAAELWEEYYRHPFVQGIQDGTLDRGKFRHYIIQDYLYLKDYARMFALGAAKAPDIETMQMFANYCKSILDNEMSVHDGYMGIFKITEEELAHTRVSLENAAYTAYMLRVAYEEDAAAICAAILACAVSYEVLAKRMVQERPACLDDPFYGTWIAEYASEEYAAENQILTAFTDRLTAGYDEARYRHLEEIFVNCSRFERMFWDMGWEMR